MNEREMSLRRRTISQFYEVLAALHKHEHDKDRMAEAMTDYVSNLKIVEFLAIVCDVKLLNEAMNSIVEGKSND